jgi:hypothetical protein
LDLEVGEWELEIGRRVYVYALVEHPGRSTTIKGRRIDIVPAGDVFAAVESNITPAHRRSEISEAALREQHAVVVALSRRFDAILPARFGSSVDVETLEHTLHMNRSAIRRALALVKGREQITVRTVGTRGDTPPDWSSGGAYLRSRMAASRPTLSPTARALKRAVKPLVRAERLEPARGNIRVTIHHLIDRGRARAYRAAVRDAAAVSSAEHVVISGPWPPFAFAPDLLS